MKLYIVNGSETGKENIDGIYYLIAETGECHYSHWCSNRWFAKGDLFENRTERISKMNEKYGNVEVLFLGDDDMTFEELLRRNKQFYEEAQS